MLPLQISFIYLVKPVRPTLNTVFYLISSSERYLKTTFKFNENYYLPNWLPFHLQSMFEGNDLSTFTILIYK